MDETEGQHAKQNVTDSKRPVSYVWSQMTIWLNNNKEKRMRGRIREMIKMAGKEERVRE